jgi:acyl-CoA thioesterase FadM
MFNSVTARMVATSDCTAVLASLKTGRSVLLPESLRRQAKTHLVAIGKKKAT